MRQIASSILILVGCVACNVSLGIPTGTQITCESNADCPGNFRCASSLGLCVPPDADDRAPGIVDGSVSLAQDVVGRGGTLTLSFAADLPLARLPEVFLGTPSRPELTVTSTGADAYEASVTLMGDEGEGAWPVLVTLVSDAGVPARDLSVGIVVLDFTDPSAVTANPVYFGVASNPVSNPTALTTGSTARVSFNTSEPVLTTPVPEVRADCAGEVLSLVRTPGESSVTFFSYTLDTLPAQDGSCTIQADLEDIAGNRASNLDLGITVAVDTTAPDVDTSTDLSLVKHLRAPYGAPQTGNVASNYLAPETLASDEAPTDSTIPTAAFDQPNDPLAVVLAYRNDSPTSLPVGTSLPVAGGWSPIVSAVEDASEMWIALADGAGNISDRRRVPHAEWVATLGGKEFGSNVQNPNNLERRRILFGGLFQDLAPTSADELARIDGTILDTKGGARWSNPRGGVAVPVSTQGYTNVTYNPLRAETLLFSGVDPSTLWYRVAGRWQERPVLDALGDGNPPPIQMFGGGIVFDARRGVAVLLAPFTVPVLWEWDEGTGWRERCDGDPLDDTCTIPRRGALLYHPGRRRVLNIAPPTGAGPSPTNEIQEWDGETWTVISPDTAPGPNSPTPRFGPLVAYDAASDEIVMFGGRDPTGNCETSATEYCNHTWVWRNGWTERATSGPQGRIRGFMIGDPDRDNVLMIGGDADVTCEGGVYCSDTWLWNGTAWSQPSVPDPEGDGDPPAHIDRQGTYDAARKRIVLHGSFDPPTYVGDTWEWNGTSWAQVQPFLSPEPSARTEVGGAYDPISEELLVAGGSNDDGSSCDGGVVVCGDTWSWTGGGWIELANIPGPRSNLSMAYDATRQRIVAFGGIQYDPGTNFGETWEWNSGWSNLGTGGPSARNGAAMAYDGSGLVLFGGSAGNNETWTRQGTTWERRCDGPMPDICTSEPSGRINAKMAYDERRGVTVMYGGSGISDIWEWNGADWVERIPSDPELDGNPGILDRPSLAYNSRLGRVVLAGGAFNPLQGGTWTWTGASWERVALVDFERDGGADDFIGSAFVDYPPQEHMVIFASDGWTNEVAVFHDSASDRAAHILRVPFAPSGVADEATIQAVGSSWVVGGRGNTTDTCSLTDGASLRVWNGNEWQVTNGGNSASYLAPDVVSWSTSTDPAFATATPTDLRDQLFVGANDEIAVAATPSAPNGCGSNYGRLVSDYAEVRVEYLLP